jgi:hypothetical protein
MVHKKHPGAPIHPDLCGPDRLTVTMRSRHPSSTAAAGRLTGVVWIGSLAGADRADAAQDLLGAECAGYLG